MASCMKVLVVLFAIWAVSIIYISTSWRKISSAKLLSLRDDSCPLEFERPTITQIKQRVHWPYLFGAVQRPKCTNCALDVHWADFCRYEKGGNVCYENEKEALLEEILKRTVKGKYKDYFEDLLTMTPCDLYTLIKGRTLWMVGDSLTQETMKTVQCFLFEFWIGMDFYHVADIMDESKAEKIQLLKNVSPTSWCIDLVENTRVCHLRGNDNIMKEVMPTFLDMAKRSDIAIFNFGLWFHDHTQYIKDLESFRDYVVANAEALPYSIFRDTSPQFFKAEHGDFDNLDDEAKMAYDYGCEPLKNLWLDEDLNLHTNDPSMEYVVKGNWRNINSREILKGHINYLEIWNTSIPISNYEMKDRAKRNDCTHFCHPSAYQVWVHAMYRRLYEDKDKFFPIQAA